MYPVIIYEFLCILSILITSSHSRRGSKLLTDGTSTAQIIGGDVFFEITDPVELKYTYRVRPARDFGAPFNESFVLKNAALVPTNPRFGCENFQNQEEVEGNVAFIERGECSFKTKTLMAEKAGARAVILTDISEVDKEYFIEMIDDDGEEEAHIPAGFLMGKNALMITKTLERLEMQYAIINLPVNLTFTPIHKMNYPPWLGW